MNAVFFGAKGRCPEGHKLQFKVIAYCETCPKSYVTKKLKLGFSVINKPKK